MAKSGHTNNFRSCQSIRFSTIRFIHQERNPGEDLGQERSGMRSGIPVQ
jgi:hypothetical protein